MNELIDYYRSQGAPQDQQMLIALLREIQETSGGVLTASALRTVSEALCVKESMLNAIIRRIPSLRMDTAPHLLEMCQTCPKGRELRAWVESTWNVQPGGACETAGFRYRVIPCMKNCKSGPSLKWDGQLYSHATKELIEQLVERKDGNK